MRAADQVKKLAKLVDPPWWKFSLKKQSSEYAAMQLWKLGPEAVPFLLKVMQGGEGTQRDAVLNALKRIGPEDGDAVPTLIKALKADPTRDICRAIGRLGPSAAPAIQELFQLMPHMKPEVQEGIMEAMTAMGPARRRGFRHALLDAGVTWTVRLKAAENIVELGADARKAVDALLIGLEDNYSQVRHMAALGMEAAGFVTVKDISDKVRDEILKRLRLTTDDVRALMTIRLLHSSDPEDLIAGAKAMVQQESQGGPVWDKIEKVLAFNPDEFGETTMVTMSTEMLIYRLITEASSRLRMEYVNELGRRRASWVGPLLKKMGQDESYDETFRFACQEVAGWL